MQNCVQLDDDGENQCQTERRESSTKLSESRDPGFEWYANLLASERLILICWCGIRLLSVCQSLGYSCLVSSAMQGVSINDVGG